MDAGVDDHLGDSIIYVRRGVALTGPIKGFPTRKNPLFNTEGINPVSESWRCKVSVRYFPDGEPHPEDRLSFPGKPKLAGTWKPGAAMLDEDGRNYIFDIERI